MAIDIRKYVRITSGVAGGAGVRERDLIGRIHTESILVSPDSILEFTNAGDVGAFFGTSSEEFKRAAFYFGYVSPSITAASKISFARYAPAGAVPRVFGGKSTKDLVALKAVVAGSIGFILGGITTTVSGLSFASAATLADVASAIQTAVRANANPQLETATVTYDATTKRFIFAGSVIDDTTVAIDTTNPTNVAALLQWLPSGGAIYTSGVPVQAPIDSVTASNGISDNYGSFLFQSALTLDEAVLVATYNATFNVKFMFMMRVDPDNMQAWSEAMITIAATSLTEALLAAEYPEMAPMISQAATDYSRANAAPNYMFRQFSGLTPSVKDTPTSDALDALRVNYYGRTQEAGQNLDFYQRGTLGGVATDPVDMNVFSNEAWLKGHATSGFMSLMLSLANVGANDVGRGQVLAVLQDTVDQGLFNGVISVGKPFTTIQKLSITQISNDERAWQQVQSIGYWMDVVIESYVTTDGRTEYEATYTLIYSKNDSIRRIVGSHVLI